ncbi:MAG: hypothetical protein IT301_13550 [Dehalococcoidia bacterium]|nr:hypothetical protein [Dehalococcoidia bacterium]
MANSEIVITLSGSKIDSRLVGKTISLLRAALDDIEKSITQEPPQAVWETGDTEVRVVASANGVDAATLAQIQHDFLDGFSAASGRETPWPATITPRARRAISNLIRQANELDAISAGAESGPMVLVTGDQARASRALGAVERTYTEHTSIDGRLDLISVRGRPRFIIQDFATGKRLLCRFDDTLISRVKDALGKRVVIEGAVKFRTDGQPLSVSSVQSIWTRPEPLRAIDDLAGAVPNFTGGEAAEAFTRRRRRGGR